MIKVKLTTNFPEWPLIRQTPNRSGTWKDAQFFINEDIDECDYWVVYDDLLRPEKTLCPPENVLLITGEPPSVKKYGRHYTNQFATILTCHDAIQHRQRILKQQGLPWMIGCRYHKATQQWDKEYSKDYDELKAASPVPKTKLISVLSSNKSFTPGHEQRLEFVRKLQAEFGDDLDVFGRGIRDVEDKWDAIAPYKYHIVLENSSYANYWTEKLADAFLANAYPFYYGCPNIADYFSENSLTPIDLKNPDAAIATIKRAMHENLYEQSQQCRQEAKHLILDNYNLFEVIEQSCRESRNDKKKLRVTLKPQAMTIPKIRRLLSSAVQRCRRLISQFHPT